MAACDFDRRGDVAVEKDFALLLVENATARG